MLQAYFVYLKIKNSDLFKSTNEINASSRKYTNLEVLRLFAAINVVFFHLIANFDLLEFQFTLGDVFRGWGASGVDIFFVISGFVIFSSYKNSQPSLKQFATSRLIRILPSYWILTCLVPIVMFLFPTIYPGGRPGGLWFATSMLFLSRTFGFDYPVLFQGWTLELEMLFYGLVALGILLFTKRSPWMFVVTALGLLTITGLVLPLAAEFLLGVLAGWLVSKYRFSKLTSWVSLISGTSLYLGLIFVEPNYEFRLLIFGIPSFLIVIGLLGVPQLNSKAWPRLGFSSYSIYLVQWFAIPLFIPLISLVPSNLINKDLLAIFITILVASLGFLYSEIVDRPIYLWLRNRLFRKIS